MCSLRVDEENIRDRGIRVHISLYAVLPGISRQCAIYLPMMVGVSI